MLFQYVSPALAYDGLIIANIVIFLGNTNFYGKKYAQKCKYYTNEKAPDGTVLLSMRMKNMGMET